MRVVATGRGIALVPVLLFLSVSTAFAHALPGSKLIFAQDAEQLELSVTVPIEELTIADRSLVALSAISPDASIPESLRYKVESYFSRHISLQKGVVILPLAVTSMSVHTASHEDVGAYAVLMLKLATGLRSGKIGPLMLRYDAVMHEVRSHRAAVYWSDPQRKPKKLNRLLRFGFKRVDGQQQLLKLELPERHR